MNSINRTQVSTHQCNAPHFSAYIDRLMAMLDGKHPDSKLQTESRDIVFMNLSERKGQA